MNLVTPKAGAKHELLFNKPASEAGLLNKSSCLARALGETKFIDMRDMILVTLCCAVKVRLRCSTNRPQYYLQYCQFKNNSLYTDLHFSKKAKSFRHMEHSRHFTCLFYSIWCIETDLLNKSSS